MPTHAPLPGLDRLIGVCQRHSLPLRLSPPVADASLQGALLFGEPVDPQLAAVYSRLGAAELGPLSLYRPGSEWMDLISRNERLREDETVHFGSSLVFGEKTGFAYYLGTVPRLANAQGLQPVVYLDGHEVQFAIPIASSVDRFFYTYSRYLERMAADFEYVHTGTPELLFPWSVAEFITSDEPLIEQVRAGRFDFLTNGYRGALKWLQQLRTASPQP